MTARQYKNDFYNLAPDLLTANVFTLIAIDVCSWLKMICTIAPVYTLIVGLFLYLLLLQFANTQQSVSLHGSLSNNSAIPPGENITLRCFTLGSSILAWTGTNYVDSRIEFVLVDQIGTMYTPNTYTTAILVNKSTDMNGRSIIESHLNITVQSGIPSSTITCHNVGTDETRAFRFQNSNTPVLTCDDGVVCPGQFRNFSCEVRDSIVLAWENNEYIGPHGNRLEFLSTERVGTVKVSELNSGVFATLTENYVQNGIQILKCELSISEFSYHSDIISVVCRNIGLDTEYSCRVRVNDDCVRDSTTTVSVDPPTNTVTIVSVGTVHSSSDPGEVTMGLGGTAIIIIITIIVVYIM